MAGAAQSRPPAVRLSYGVPQLIALRATNGRTVPSKFPDPHTGALEQVVFELPDGSPLYLSFEDAGELEHQLIALGIRAGEDFRLIKVKMPHGGGAAIRVERASDPEPYRGSRPERPAQRTYRPAGAAAETEIERKLQESVQIARRDPEQAREAFREAAAPVSPSFPTAPAFVPASSPFAPPPVGSQPIALSLHLRGLIEQVAAAKAFAASLGLDLTTDDLRSLTITAFIHEARR